MRSLAERITDAEAALKVNEASLKVKEIENQAFDNEFRDQMRKIE